MRAIQVGKRMGGYHTLPEYLKVGLHPERLAQHQLRPVLQRLRQVHGLDLLTPRQVCNRARQFENAVICPRRQIELRHRCPHQALTFFR